MALTLTGNIQIGGNIVLGGDGTKWVATGGVNGATGSRIAAY